MERMIFLVYFKTAGGLDVQGDLEVDNTKQHDEDMEAFYKMVEDAGKELYPGCKYSKLRFIVRLLHIKFVGFGAKSSRFGNACS